MGSDDQTSFVEKSFDLLDLDSEIQSILYAPMREVKVEIPIKLTTGAIKRYQGFRIQHNNFCGPFKGGIRYHKSVDMEHCRTLAFLMTWKTALFRLPFGGAKGGISCDPSKLDVSDLENITKTFCSKLHPLLGPNLDVMAPDLGTGEREMGWVFDAYSKREGFTPSVVTGKPLILEGISGRKQATGRSVYLATQLAAKEYLGDQKKVTVAIQGFGNVGSFLAKYLCTTEKKGQDQGHGHHYQIVAIGDAGGAIKSSQGLDINTLFEESQKDDFQSVTETSHKAQSCPSDQLLTQKVDILIPAALGGVINESNMREINCKIIVEAANSPVTGKAHRYLTEKGVKIIPDIFANAGGVLASYLEWKSGKMILDEGYSQDDVLNCIEKKMNHIWREIKKVCTEYQISLRDAAYYLAIKRVEGVLVKRGAI